MYNISFHTFQIVSVITQELCSANIMVLSEFDKRVLKAKIDFLINASKLEILLRRQRPTTCGIHYCMQHES